MKKQSILIPFFIFIITSNLPFSTTNVNASAVDGDDHDLPVENYEFLLKFFNADIVKTEKYWQIIADTLPRLVYINLKKQELTLLEFGQKFQIILQTPISSGLKPGSTPTGTFVISKKRIARNSKKYGGTMTYWNCLTPNEAIGIHGLRDNNYEQFLGQAVSHGCIRIGRNIEREFYQLTPIGTLVVIATE